MNPSNKFYQYFYAACDVSNFHPSSMNLNLRSLSNFLLLLSTKKFLAKYSQVQLCVNNFQKINSGWSNQYLEKTSTLYVFQFHFVIALN